MSIKFERVKKGDLLWDVRTAHGQVRTYQVKVLEIDHEKGHASCSWNDNKPTYYSKGQIERLRRRRPVVARIPGKRQKHTQKLRLRRG